MCWWDVKPYSTTTFHILVSSLGLLLFDVFAASATVINVGSQKNSDVNVTGTCSTSLVPAVSSADTLPSGVTVFSHCSSAGLRYVSPNCLVLLVSVTTRLQQIVYVLKVGFHYPSSWPEFTGRQLG